MQDLVELSPEQLGRAKPIGAKKQATADTSEIDKLQGSYTGKYGSNFTLSGRDTSTHLKLHGAGNAWDVSVKGMSPEQKRYIVDTATSMGLEAADYSDPHNHPKVWHGPHIHVQRPDKHNPPQAGLVTFSDEELKRVKPIARGSSSQLLAPKRDAYATATITAEDTGHGRVLGSDTPLTFLEKATRPFAAASTLIGGATREFGAGVSAIAGGDREAADEYARQGGGGLLGGTKALAKAVWKKLQTGEDTPGFEEPAGKAYDLLVEHFGGNPESAVHQIMHNTITMGTDPVTYLGGELLEEHGALPGVKKPVEGRPLEPIKGKLPASEKPRLSAEEFKKRFQQGEPSSATPSPTAPTVGLGRMAGASSGGTANPAVVGLGNWLRSFGASARNVVPRSPGTPGGMSAGFKDLFSNTGLNRLRAASTESFEAALRTAGSSGMAKHVMQDVVPEIEKASGMKWDQFASVLAESRLRGIRQRWVDMRSAVMKASEGDLQDSLKPNGAFGALLDSLSATHNFPSDLRRQALANLTQGPNALRLFLADAFDTAAAKTGAVHLGPQPYAFERIVKSPKFQAGLKLYKDEVESKISDAYQANDGVLSGAKGPLNTYYPLLARDASGELRSRIGLGSRVRSTFQRPKAVTSKFATGQAADYSMQAQDFESHLAGALRSNNLGALIKTIRDVFPDVTAYTGGPVPEGYVKVDAAPPRTVVGRTTDVRPSVITANPAISARTTVTPLPGQQVLMPEWMYRELRPMLEPGKSHYTPQNYRDWVGAMTNWFTQGIAEPAFHSAKITKDIVSGTPFLGKDMVNKTVGNVPLVKYFNGIGHLVNQPIAESELLRIEGKLAEAGMLPERFGSHGLGSRFLFGRRGVDARARVLMYKVLESVEPNPSPSQVFDFVGQMGVYNRQLEGAVARFTKDLGLGTFYSAGSSRLANALRTWTFQSKLPAGNPGWRIVQAISGGAVGSVAMWAGAHRAITGKWPWEDPASRLMELPLPEHYRKSSLGQTLYGPGNDTAYVGLDWTSHVAGGARLLGLGKGYNTLREGGTFGQALEAGGAQAISSAVQPAVSGPLVHDAGTALFGTAPVLTGFRDPITGQFKPQFLSSVETKKPGVSQLGENAKEAIIGSSSFLRNLASLGGYGEDAQRRGELTLGGRLLRQALDLAFPALIKEQVDLKKTRKKLVRQERTLERKEVKQDAKKQSLQPLEKLK
jgi:hypothetical protein